MSDYFVDKASSLSIAARRKPLNFVAFACVVILVFVYLHNPGDASSSRSSGPLLPNHDKPGTVIASPGRELDVLDAFEDFVKTPNCSLSSLDLHAPFFPLCKDKNSLLEAVSSGGRSGVNEPYQPRGCDMRWFLTAEICDIVSRYDTIYVIGDSMMRNLAVAMHVYLRANLYEGPAAQWVKPPDDLDCHCRGPFETAACMWYVSFSTSDLLKNVPAGLPHSVKCPQNNMAMIEYIPETAYPLGDSVNGIIDRLPKQKPDKPQAFIMGHGVWNSLNETATNLWLEEIETAINKTNPWLTNYPRLFITPNAAGDNKPVQYQETQGNVALHRFETTMRPIVQARGFDHLGMYNSTIQSSSPDGTHAGMTANLIKAMFVYNWLAFSQT